MRTSSVAGFAFAPFFIWAFFIVCWVINLIQFANCDFNAPYKGEVIHAIGIVAAPAAVVTVWFGDDK